MWHPVYVVAETREKAIAIALKTKPAYIPTGTALYYGEVGGIPVAYAS
jgi:hypothetical protein